MESNINEIDLSDVEDKKNEISFLEKKYLEIL